MLTTDLNIKRGAAQMQARPRHTRLPGQLPSMTTGGEYCDNPLRLANEIDAAPAKHGLAKDRHVITSIKFFEGELRLIAECLRCVGPQKVAKQPRMAISRVAAGSQDCPPCGPYHRSPPCPVHASRGSFRADRRARVCQLNHGRRQ